MEPFISADQPITARSLPSEFSDSGAPLPQNTNTKHSHLHGLHHSDKHHRPRHHRHHSHRHVRDAVQAATVSDLLKPASRSSPHSSTRHVPDSSHSSVAKSEANGESNIPPPKPVKPEDVASERLNMKIREKELRSSLQTLSEHSLKASRRLDDTYYSILEKVSLLRQNIGNLQELSTLTKELHETFQSDTRDLADDVAAQIDAFSNFEPQEEQLEKLESRIRVGKEKSAILNDKLMEARKRVEARAKIEAEWEAKTKRRRRVLFGIFSIFIGLIVVAMLIQQFKPIQSASNTRVSVAAVAQSRLKSSSIPDPVKQVLMRQSPLRSSSYASSTPLPSSPPIGEDQGLRIFDEL